MVFHGTDRAKKRLGDRGIGLAENKLIDYLALARRQAPLLGKTAAPASAFFAQARSKHCGDERADGFSALAAGACVCLELTHFVVTRAQRHDERLAGGLSPAGEQGSLVADVYPQSAEGVPELLAAGTNNGTREASAILCPLRGEPERRHHPGQPLRTHLVVGAVSDEGAEIRTGSRTRLCAEVPAARFRREGTGQGDVANEVFGTAFPRHACLREAQEQGLTAQHPHRARYDRRV